MNHPTDEQIDRAAVDIAAKAQNAMPLPVIGVTQHRSPNGKPFFCILLDTSRVPNAPDDRASVYLTFMRGEDIGDPDMIDRKIKISANIVRNRILPSALAHEHRG